MPYGQQISKKPVLGKSSESLGQWDHMSRTYSIEFIHLSIFESEYQLQHCSEYIEVTTNSIIDEYSLSTYPLIKRDVDIAFSKWIVDITVRWDSKFMKFRQTPWIHSTGNPLCTNHNWWDSTIEKQHKAPFMSASYNSQ